MLEEFDAIAYEIMADSWGYLIKRLNRQFPEINNYLEIIRVT